MTTSIREKAEIIKGDITKQGHNCGWCQPYIEGELVKAGCLVDCRPDTSKRGEMHFM